MLRRPPISALFPYTTALPISPDAPDYPEEQLEEIQEQHLAHLDFFERSEEHTSELQSRVDLVCRLLLEKKKPRRLHSVVPLHHVHYVLADWSQRHRHWLCTSN